MAALEATLQHQSTRPDVLASCNSSSSTRYSSQPKPFDANDNEILSDTIHVSVVPCQSQSQPDPTIELDADKGHSSARSLCIGSRHVGTNYEDVDQGEQTMDLGHNIAPSDDPSSPRDDSSRSSVLSALSTSTQDYLSQLFWTTYNDTFPFINKELFLKAKAQDNRNYYSKTLELCIWLAGVRFADRTRTDIAVLFVPHTAECKLYRLAKEAVEADMETQTCLPLVQAFLLLADMEASLGHYSAGWMYIGECGPFLRWDSQGELCKRRLISADHRHGFPHGPQHGPRLRQHLPRAPPTRSRSSPVYPFHVPRHGKVSHASWP